MCHSSNWQDKSVLRKSTEQIIIVDSISPISFTCRQTSLHALASFGIYTLYQKIYSQKAGIP